MNRDIIRQYLLLVNEYPELCFKFKQIDELKTIKNQFILGIVSNNGPLYFLLDYKLWNEFNVKELGDNYTLEGFKYGTIDNLLNDSFTNVNYFDIKNGVLNNYFGNRENVIIPGGVKTIMRHAYYNNNKIKSVQGDDVETTIHYAFGHNSNLEKINLNNTNDITHLIDIPHLQEITVGDKFHYLSLEDDIPTNLKFIIHNDKGIHKYAYDQHIDDYFFETLTATCDPDEKISMVYIDGVNNRFKFTKDNNRDHYQDKFMSICLFEKIFEKIPLYIKEILNTNNVHYFIINNFDCGGSYIDKLKLILLDMNVNSLKYCCYHEIGHALDYLFEHISQYSEFKKIFFEERTELYQNIHSHQSIFLSKSYINHAISSSEEFFAECFNRYMTGEGEFKIECPKAHQFIDNFTNKLKQDFLSNEKSKVLGYEKNAKTY